MVAMTFTFALARSKSIWSTVVLVFLLFRSTDPDIFASCDASAIAAVSVTDLTVVVSVSVLTVAVSIKAVAVS